MGGTTEPTGVIVGEEGVSFLRAPEPDVHIAGDPLGRTYTPADVALACCQALSAMGCSPHRVREPCVGGGAFVRAALETWPMIPEHGWIDRGDIDAAAPGLAPLYVRAFGLTMLLRGDRQVADATDRPGAGRAEWATEQPGDFAHLTITNPPFGEAVGDLDVRIYHAQRPACDWLALLMPVEHACLHRWAGPMQTAVVVPLTGRVWPVVRGMALYVWGPGLRPVHPPITHGGRR